MKKGFLLILWAALLLPVWGQVSPAQNLNKHKDMPKIYDEKADAMSQIDQALEEARESGRFVICQVGGNWCPWCLRFAKFITEDEEIANVVKENFVYIHVNTSKANKNEEALRRLGNPGRFGYPVFVILDDEGRVMHIQNSSYLEEGKSYNHKLVLQFFQNWTRKAIDELK